MTAPKSKSTLERLLEGCDDQRPSKQMLEQLALSVVGQCVYYRFGSGVIEILIPEEERNEHYDIESLSRHITSVMLARAR